MKMCQDKLKDVFISYRVVKYLAMLVLLVYICIVLQRHVSKTEQA